MKGKTLLGASTVTCCYFFKALPDLGALMPEELKELGNEDIEWSVNSITVQGLCIVFTDLLKCSKCSL